MFGAKKIVCESQLPKQGKKDPANDAFCCTHADFERCLVPKKLFASHNYPNKERRTPPTTRFAVLTPILDDFWYQKNRLRVTITQTRKEEPRQRRVLLYSR